MTRSTRRATCQDVLDAPAHRVAEIVDGTLHLRALLQSSAGVVNSLRRLG